MSILIDASTRIVVQGITGKTGSFHAEKCMQYGSQIVAGVTPGKGGQSVLGGIPVFDSVEQSVKEVGANASLIFVPPAFAIDSILEAVDAGISLVVCITEGIPVKDMMLVKNKLATSKTRLIGPNCPGIISPGKCKMGIMPGHIHREGHLGILSRSGTLTYEAVWQLTEKGQGQSTCIGIGGDPIVGTSFVDALKLFNEDPQTEGVILIGEIGGSAEEEAAAYVKGHFKKPMAAFIAGLTAPKGKRMGHAGAIVSGNEGTARSKIEALQASGIEVAITPADIADAMLRSLKKAGR